MSCKPIQINDKGCIFRSKLEWRHTEMFEALGIQWKYEPQVFDLSNSSYLTGYPPNLQWYLPDFQIVFPSGLTCYLEVKPRITRQSIAKLRLKALAHHTGVLTLMSENFYKSLPAFWWYDPLNHARIMRPTDYARLCICSYCRKVLLRPAAKCSCNAPVQYNHPMLEKALARTKVQIDETKIWTSADSRQKGSPLRRTRYPHRQNL